LTAYQAIYIEEVGENEFSKKIVQRSTDKLPDGDLLVKVLYSSLNQKDAMSAHGHRGVTKTFPHQPGVDAAGVVEVSCSPDFNPGDEVIVTGFDLGMNTPGGLGGYIRVPAEWVLKCPPGMTPRQSMLFGTAGLTAALSIMKLEHNGLKKNQGPVLVTGSTGGVGSISILMLSKLGYEVVASSGKASQKDFLMSLGASRVIDRNELSTQNRRSMLEPVYAGAVDVVGGHTLENIIRSLMPGASVAASGRVQSASFDPTVFPFILRGVNLLGIEAVETPLEDRIPLWRMLANIAGSEEIEKINEEINLAQVPDYLDRLFRAGMVGHTLVNVQ